MEGVDCLGFWCRGVSGSMGQAGGWGRKGRAGRGGPWPLWDKAGIMKCGLGKGHLMAFAQGSSLLPD